MKQMQIISPVSKVDISKEVSSLENQLLVELKHFKAFYAYANQIPNTLREIGRLREMTYREVGEGTGNEIDLDEFDPRCEHIFIWDEEQENVVGAYRILNGKKTIDQYGIQGFYINTLFRIDDKLTDLLSQSLELGRSFIVKEYQKRPTPLFILWKALLFSILNSDARYLIGPVSISGKFSEEAKSITLEFLKRNYCHHELAESIHPINDFSAKFPDDFNTQDFFKEVGQDFGKLDKFIQKYEQSYNTPILVRQYISLLNTSVIGFNIDPLFNNCLDALMLMDLSKAPQRTIENLVKDYPNPSDIYEKLRNYEYRA